MKGVSKYLLVAYWREILQIFTNITNRNVLTNKTKSLEIFEKIC